MDVEVKTIIKGLEELKELFKLGQKQVVELQETLERISKAEIKIDFESILRKRHEAFFVKFISVDFEKTLNSKVIEIVVNAMERLPTNNNQQRYLNKKQAKADIG